MKTAADFMNRTFFHASPSDTIGVLLHDMAERGIGSVPVLDFMGRPLGVAKAGEIERCYDVEELIGRIERPAVCMDWQTPVEIAARALAQQPSCCLLVVDGSGIAVGALSAVELLGAVLGIEGARDAETLHAQDAAWDRAHVLELGAAHRAPNGPGVILLSPGLDQSQKRRVWAESTANMRERLDQMLREPQAEECLESMLEVYPRTVRFRCLTVEDQTRRDQLADALCTMGTKSGRGAPVTLEPGASPPSGIVASGISGSVAVDA